MAGTAKTKEKYLLLVTAPPAREVIVEAMKQLLLKEFTREGIRRVDENRGIERSAD